jgi:P-type E1-E2 ATPase
VLQERIAEVASLLETGLGLLGCTAIEDKLQEAVPESIALLRRAGIRFFMLTGDRYSTAVQIARACGLAGSGMNRRSWSGSVAGRSIH